MTIDNSKLDFILINQALILNALSLLTFRINDPFSNILQDQAERVAKFVEVNINDLGKSAATKDSETDQRD